MPTCAVPPRVLYASNRELLKALHHSRPRDLSRITAEVPGVTVCDGRFEPLKRGETFDILLVGALLNPIFKPVPPHTPFDPSGIAAVPKRALFIHDAHRSSFHGGHRALQRFINENIHYVILAYECRETEKLLSGCPELRQVHALGNHIDMDVFKDYGLAKDIDVLLYGQTDSSNYPFRHRLAALLSKAPFKTHIVPHPAEAGNLEAPRDEALSQLINRSWLAIATPSRHKYLVAKYLEISASRTVIAGNIPRADRHRWRGHYIRLDESMSDREILKRLKTALSDKTKLREMATAMYEPIRREFGYPQYEEKFRAILRAIHEDGNP